MRFVLAGLVIVAASACSAHNSHSIVLDPVEALPPLVDEALQNLQQAFGEPLPIDFVALGVAVEPVSVRWVSPANPAEAVQIESILAEAVQKRVRTTDPAQALYFLKIALVLDLNDPDEVALLVSSELDESGERQKTLASASSGFVALERLYCHGCRDSQIGRASCKERVYSDV